MNRRGFLGTILAAGAAPSIVRASSLMPILMRKPTIIVPELIVSSVPACGLLTIEQITREALTILHKQLVFTTVWHTDFDVT